MGIERKIVMKVAIRGTKDYHLIEYRANCPNCNSVLEYNEIDVMRHMLPSSSMNHMINYYYIPYIKCPVCGNEINVTSRTLAESEE